jgi:hypothetical protein
MMLRMTSAGKSVEEYVFGVMAVSIDDGSLHQPIPPAYFVRLNLAERLVMVSKFDVVVGRQKRSGGKIAKSSKANAKRH